MGILKKPNVNSLPAAEYQVNTPPPPGLGAYSNILLKMDLYRYCQLSGASGGVWKNKAFKLLIKKILPLISSQLVISAKQILAFDEHRL